MYLFYVKYPLNKDQERQRKPEGLEKEKYKD